LKAAQDNPGIDRIVLHIDSPGGQVGGIADLASYIQGRVTKPVIAYIGDMGASAAYWIASAADTIVAAQTSEIGSIGVVLTTRRRPDNQIEIVSSASPKKRPDPATDEGRAVLQGRADALAAVFTHTVAKNRGLTQGHIEALEGDIFIAKKALDLGLIDSIGTLESTISGTSEKAPARQTHRTGFMDQVNALAQKDNIKKSEAMERVAAREPHLYQSWLLDCQRGTPAQELSAPATATGKRADFMALVDAHQAQHGGKRSDAIGAIAAAYPEIHRAWIEAQQF
jgi:ClpP class serine protease